MRWLIEIIACGFSGLITSKKWKKKLNAYYSILIFFQMLHEFALVAAPLAVQISRLLFEFVTPLVLGNNCVGNEYLKS